MAPAHFALLVGSWLLWMAPFVPMFRRPREQSAKIDTRARWGILVQSVAYWILWASPFWRVSPAWWRVALACVSFAVGIVLCWMALSALGRQWRIDAGLNADHELVRSGPYRRVRHPIYLSMLEMLCGTGLVVTPFPILVLAIAIFLAGTEIRVRVEDSLLASRFPKEFPAYRASVWAYLPYVR